MHNFSQSLKGLKADLREQLGDGLVALYLIGSAAESRRAAKDIDIVAVVSEKVAIIEFLHIAAKILYRHTLSVKCLVTCFPIYENVFTTSDSRFVKNVYEFGIELYERPSFEGRKR